MWTGKIIGGIIGSFLFPPLGIFIGIYVGHAFDKANEQGRTGFAFEQQTHPDSQRLFIETLFRLLGHLAKADGRISKQEIHAAEQFMAQPGLSAEHRQKAIQEFQHGASTAFILDQQMRDFVAVCSRNGRLKQTLLVYLINMALADGGIDSAERRVLEKVCQSLGIPGLLLDQYIRMVNAQQQFRSGAEEGSEQGASGGMPSHSQLKLAYEALGVSESASDAQIKKAYRKLMSENHPDKLMGQGVPENMIKMATERSKEISKAYDLIKEARK